MFEQEREVRKKTPKLIWKSSVEQHNKKYTGGLDVQVQLI